MNVAIIVAVVALVSTIVGATIGAATTYVLAVRRERADRTNEERRHTIEIRRAARMIGAELMWAAAAASSALRSKTLGLPSTTMLPLPPDVRLKYLDLIASDLPDAAWLDINLSLQAAETMRQITQSPIDRSVPLPDDVLETVVPLKVRIDGGLQALAPYQFTGITVMAAADRVPAGEGPEARRVLVSSLREFSCDLRPQREPWKVAPADSLALPRDGFSRSAVSGVSRQGWATDLAAIARQDGGEACAVVEVP